jgi:hypothetical protein
MPGWRTANNDLAAFHESCEGGGMVVFGPAFKLGPADRLELRVRKPEGFGQELRGKLDAVAFGHRDGVDVPENFRRRYHARRDHRDAMLFHRLRLRAEGAGKKQGNETQDSHDATSPHYMRYSFVLAA